MHEFHEWSQHMTLVRFSPSWMSMVEKLVKWRPCLPFLLNWVSSLVSTCTDHGVYGMLIFHHCLVTDWDGKQLPLHRGLYRFLCGVHTSTMWGWGLVLYLGENSRVKQCFLIIILFAIQVVVFDSFFCCYWKQGIGFTMLNTWYIEPEVLAGDPVWLVDDPPSQSEIYPSTSAQSSELNDQTHQSI